MAGCRGRWGAVQPTHERQQHLCRGMGVPYSSPKNARLGPAHRHVPLCVGAVDLYFGICSAIRRVQCTPGHRLEYVVPNQVFCHKSVA